MYGDIAAFKVASESVANYSLRTISFNLKETTSRSSNITNGLLNHLPISSRRAMPSIIKQLVNVNSYL